MEDLERIIGATILEVTGCERESGCVTFVTDRGTLKLLHRQNCCERVYLEDANGDIADLIGGVVSVAEERSNQEGEEGRVVAPNIPSTPSGPLREISISVGSEGITVTMVSRLTPNGKSPPYRKRPT